MCCRIFPILIIAASFILNLLIWYFEKEVPSFSFFTHRDEVFNFIGTWLFIAVIPTGIYYWLNDSKKYRDKARKLALLGFLPAVLLLLILIFG